MIRKRWKSQWEHGVKDTVTEHANEKVRILFPTDSYKSNNEPYMYHCYILEHEDAGMMGQFTVV
jgi:bilirubin oxidase